MYHLDQEMDLLHIFDGAVADGSTADATVIQQLALPFRKEVPTKTSLRASLDFSGPIFIPSTLTLGFEHPSNGDSS